MEQPARLEKQVSASWHAVPSSDVMSMLESGSDGLSTAEASSRRARFGPNRLTVQRPASIATITIQQLRSVIVWLLLGAVAVALVFGDRVEAIAVASVLFINTGLGVFTELRARRAIEGLLALDVPFAIVVRDGGLRVVDAVDLVPGDLIELTAGQQVAADARLIQAADLRIDEAPLTGESFPVEKQPGSVLASDTPLADRVNMVYKGSTALSGSARAVVTATGSATEVGRIGVLVGSVTIEPTPLERRLDVLGRRLVWLTCGVAALVATLGAVNGAGLHIAIEMGIALAVAAVPEALPAVVTIALAVGVRRMALRHALVRRLPAVESLGSTTVVCTDKTRTLTSGQMTAVQLWCGGRVLALDRSPAPLLGALDRHLLEAAALASRVVPEVADQPGARGRDPVDLAMLNAAAAAAVDGRTQIWERLPVGEVPFSSERKLMATFHRTAEGTVAFAKGAPRAILAISQRVQTSDGALTLDEIRRAEVIEANDRLAGQGLRVLAVASGPVDETGASALKGLTFLGLVGLEDPPAPEVEQTIRRLRAAGLRTVMLTGDQRLTAEAIGRRLGLLEPTERALDARELDRMSSADVDTAAATVAAFSRITPEHKLRIVQALQARGEIVAMLGDGVNDAAALKQADVGVAMGIRGTDVAKQAASVVLADDRFGTIAAAVEEGRVIFDNIRKFVFYLFSCNLAEILVLLVAGVFALPLPLLPLQLLWLNLVTDTFPALALALEPAEGDVMARPPRRPEETILSKRFLAAILAYGILISSTTLAAFLWALQVSPSHASTVAFMTLALAQVAHLGNARSQRPVLHPRRAVANRYALAGVTIAVGLQAAAAFAGPLANLLQVTTLDWADWVVIGSAASIPAVAGQGIKLVRARPRRAIRATAVDHE